MCAYIHTQIYICISMHTDSQGLGDRRMRRNRCDAAKGKHSIFGHYYSSLFIPVAAYDKVVQTVPILPA